MGSIAEPIARELLDSDICWDLRPLPEPAPMSGDEMVTESIIDGLAFRLLAVEAIDALRTVTLERDRLRAELIRLREAARA